jgi:FMN reductase
MLWSSPMYQGTISGAFKNALDWLHVLGQRDPPYLHDKVIGLISAAGGTQGLQAINAMEFSVRALRGWAVPYVVPVAAAARVFDGEGRIHDEGVARQLEMLGGEVVRVAERFTSDDALHRQSECDDAAECVVAAA